MPEKISLLTFSSGSLNLVVDMLAFISEWCKENGYTDVRVGNTENGHEVTANLPEYENKDAH